MSINYFNNARRWSRGQRRDASGKVTSLGVTPEESRIALLAIVQQMGARVYSVEEYDALKDLWTVNVSIWNETEEKEKYKEIQIRGELVVETVRAMRLLAGVPAGAKLMRPSEIRAAKRQAEIDASLKG